MARLRVCFVLPLLAVMLSACQVYVDATLFNNSGEGVKMQTSGGTVAIAPNQSARLTYPNETYDRVFRLAIGNCVYLYEVPDVPDDYHLPDFQFRSGRGVQIQVEKDFSVNLLPPLYKGDGPASDEVILRHKGFPLQPVAKRCGAEVAR